MSIQGGPSRLETNSLRALVILWCMWARVQGSPLLVQDYLNKWSPKKATHV
jgi:hypothetical protein